MNRRYRDLGLLIAAIIFVSCSHNDKADTAPEPIRVKTISAATTEITGSRPYSGTIEESSGTSLSFPVSGTVQSITVSEGDRVARGRLIATLDQSTLRNAYDIAKATLDQAQDAYDRMKLLHDSNSLPDMQWVEVQNTLKQAQSSEAIAKRALSDGNLYAPVSGYVSQRFVEPGMTVAPIEPIVKIVTIDPIKVNVSIPENEISSISIGQDATISVGALGSEIFHGTITERGVAADPLSRAYNVKIRVNNPDGKLLPGMICDVVLQNDSTRQVMVLPMASVLLDADNNNYVWTDSDGHAVKRYVTVEGMTDDGIIISSGLDAGDAVIVEGQQKVSSGSELVTNY